MTTDKDAEIERLKKENDELRAEVERKKGWNPPPFTPSPEFKRTHRYLGGGMWEKKEEAKDDKQQQAH